MVPWGYSCRILGAVAALIPGAAWAGISDLQEPGAPKKELSLEDRGDIFMARKMFREAIETYLKAEPMTAVVLNKTGIAYQQQNDLELAKKYYGRATKADPEYAEAINNLGTVYYAQKSYSRAIRYYKRALRLRPRSASILSNLGTAWFARRNYKQAFETYQQALEIDPQVFEKHGNQGVLLEERDIEERAKFNYYMARLYAKRGMNELALQYIRKALEGGFKDKKKFREEEDFTALRKLPEFDELMKLEPRVL
jgi:tetratricopeptide (TPR) repeat protein